MGRTENEVGPQRMSDHIGEEFEELQELRRSQARRHRHLIVALVGIGAVLSYGGWQVWAGGGGWVGIAVGIIGGLALARAGVSLCTDYDTKDRGAFAAEQARLARDMARKLGEEP